MAPKQPSTTTQISKVQLPKWVEDASESNYKFAQDIANKPLVQYGGKTVADTSSGTQQAWDLIQNGAGAPMESFNKAGDIYGALAGGSGYTPITADQVRAGQFGDVNLSQYMNPYIQNVEDKALGALDQSRIKSLMGNADAATKARAFGGSRAGVVDAVTNAETALNAGQLSANLRSDAFNKATDLATGDLNRGLQGALANQQSNLAAGSTNINAALGDAGLKANAAAGLTGLGDSQSKALLQQFTGLATAGGQQQQQQQAELDAEKAKFDEVQGYDTERLNLLLASLGMSPYGKTQTTTTTAKQGNSGFDFAQGGMGLLSILGGMFGGSDETMKTDIVPIGKDKATGLKMYSYRYRGDPKTYPKVVGPMAQEVEKKFPGVTVKAGNKMAVPMDILKQFAEVQ